MKSSYRWQRSHPSKYNEASAEPRCFVLFLFIVNSGRGSLYRRALLHSSRRPYSNVLRVGWGGCHRVFRVRAKRHRDDLGRHRVFLHVKTPLCKYPCVNVSYATLPDKTLEGTLMTGTARLGDAPGKQERWLKTTSLHLRG